jgi:hypothetical protein
MLTLCASPKAFLGHIGVIQRNAVTSWALLRPRPEILLFGDDPGVAEICREFGLRHVPDVASTESGTPRLDDLLAKADQLATNRVIGYANADIIFLSDFMRAVETVARWRERFLMVGFRCDLDLDHLWDFRQPEEVLRQLAREKGFQRGASAVDYFVFPRGLYRDMPPFALGRTYWDHWMVWKAQSLGVPVVDASPSVVAIHQNHEYVHPQGRQGVWYGEEAWRNWELAGKNAARTIEDATYKLRRGKVRPNIFHFAVVIKRHSRRIRRALGLYPPGSPLPLKTPTGDSSTELDSPRPERN